MPTPGVVTETPNPTWWGRKPKLDKIVFRVVAQALASARPSPTRRSTSSTRRPTPTSSPRPTKRSDAVIEKIRSSDLDPPDLNGHQAAAQRRQRPSGRSRTPLTSRRMAAVIQKPLGVTPSRPRQCRLRSRARRATRTSPSTADSASASPRTPPPELKLAGYTKGTDVRLREGRQAAVTPTITVPSDTPTNAQRAQLIQGFLKKAGITVKLDTVPSAKCTSTATTSSALVATEIDLVRAGRPRRSRSPPPRRCSTRPTAGRPHRHRGRRRVAPPRHRPRRLTRAVKQAALAERCRRGDLHSSRSSRSPRPRPSGSCGDGLWLMSEPRSSRATPTTPRSVSRVSTHHRAAASHPRVRGGRNTK